VWGALNSSRLQIGRFRTTDLNFGTPQGLEGSTVRRADSKRRVVVPLRARLARARSLGPVFSSVADDVPGL
jgi:hypothetical protein